MDEAEFLINMREPQTQKRVTQERFCMERKFLKFLKIPENSGALIRVVAMITSLSHYVTFRKVRLVLHTSPSLENRDMNETLLFVGHVGKQTL